jgi:hypothetical protein
MGNVIPSDRKDKYGNPIYVPAPTPEPVQQNGRWVSPPSSPSMTYYKTAEGNITYRVGGAAAPAGASEISQVEYDARKTGEPQQAVYTTPEGKKEEVTVSTTLKGELKIQGKTFTSIETAPQKAIEEKPTAGQIGRAHV